MFDVRLSVSIERQGWKDRFQTTPAPSRFSPTNSYRADFKPHKRKPRGVLSYHYICNLSHSKRWMSNNFEKYSIRAPRMRSWVFVCRLAVVTPFNPIELSTLVFPLVGSGERRTQTLQITKIRRFQPQRLPQTTLQVIKIHFLDLDFIEIMFRC